MAKGLLPLAALLLSGCPDIVNTPNFNLSLSPTSLTITQGGSGTTQLTITPQNGFTGTVNLSLDNPPAGVSLSPDSVWVGSLGVTKTLTISTTADTPTGQYTLTLKATSGSIVKTATLTLTVNPATTFTVNTTDDTIDIAPGDGKCADSSGNCSLRAAVMEANHLNAPVVINIPAGIYTLTLTGQGEQGGDLDIKSNVTLKGAGAGQTILDGNAADRVLQIYGGATVRVEGVTIQNGKADGGGGIYNEGTLTLTGSTVSGNTANYGGGIDNSDGTLSLINSTVSGNKAKQGGGVYSFYITNLSFSTLTGNQATGTNSAGGGIYINSGTVKLKGVILAGNTGGSGPECSGSLTSQGCNLIGNNTGCSLAVKTGDITNQDPLLGPLANNGGPTQTHLPQAGSPVLDKVPTRDCTTLDGTVLTIDQRGVKRPQGAACDIGAVERQ